MLGMLLVSSWVALEHGRFAVQARDQRFQLCQPEQDPADVGQRLLLALIRMAALKVSDRDLADVVEREVCRQLHYAASSLGPAAAQSCR